MSEPQPFYERSGFFKGFAAAVAAYEGGHGHIFEQVEFGQESMLLEYEAYAAIAEFRQSSVAECKWVVAVVSYCARVGDTECAKNLQQGGFAGAAGSDNGGYMTGYDVQVDAFQHLERAKVFLYAASLYHNAKLSKKKELCKSQLFFW